MEKAKVFKEIKDWYGPEDLDSHVHIVKSEEASAINNSGIDAQLEYLSEQCGLNWLIDTFLDK